MGILALLALAAALLVIAGVIKSQEVFKRLDAESRAREAALWATAFSITASSVAGRELLTKIPEAIY